MKTILTLAALLAAMIVVKTSNANSQDTCTPAYVSCMDACVAKKAGQDQCIGICQQKNDQFVSAGYAWNLAGNTPQPGARFVADRVHQLWITSVATPSPILRGILDAAPPAGQ